MYFVSEKPSSSYTHFFKSIAEEVESLPKIARLELQVDILQLVMQKVKQYGTAS